MSAVTASSARHAVLTAVETGDAVGTLCARLYPPAVRGHYLTLRAFDAELRGVRTSVSNELLGRIKLAWWRDAVRVLYSGIGKPPAHPIIMALGAAVHDPQLRQNPAGGLREGHLQSLIDARETDLASQTPGTLEEIEAGAEKAESRLLYLAQNLVGVPSYALPRQDIGAAEVVLSHLGKAQGVVRVLSQMHGAALGTARAASMGLLPDATLAAGGLPARVLVPLDLLAQYGLTETDVLRYFTPSSGQSQGSDSLPPERVARVQEAVYEMATRAHDYLLSARVAYRDGQHTVDPESLLNKQGWNQLRPVLAEAAGVTSFLSRLQRARFDLRNPRFHPSQQRGNIGLPARILWTSWTGRF